MEVEREPHRIAVDTGKHDLRIAPRPKERLPQVILGRHDLVREVLKLRKLADEGEDQSDLTLLGGAHA